MVDNVATKLIVQWRNASAVNVFPSRYHSFVSFNLAGMPELSALAIFALGLMALAARRFKKQA
mgnify:CR=1 FL=1